MFNQLFSRPPRSPAQAYRWRMETTQGLRRVVQAAFLAFILYTAIVHNLATEDGTTASIDALCPLGGVETLFQWATTGQYISKTHLSNLILALGLLIGTLFAGGAFCGWVCPLGTVQDGLAWLRAKLHLPDIQVPPLLDRVLRYGRFVVLALIVYQTIYTVKLWFADFDPYRTLFGLGWLFEFNLAESWVAYTITGGVLLTSLVVERAWCRYACPLGGVISLLGNFSLLRIKRNGVACRGCSICERPCPVKLNVATAQTVSSNCIGCLACVEACPRHGALEVQLSPTWLPQRPSDLIHIDTQLK